MPTCATREQSLTNLCIALNEESNTAARYAAFAQRADEEGYRKVANLFRAVARSEQIHAANHAAAMQTMGSTHPPTIEPVELKSTVENLRTAIAGEQYEIDQQYPGFLREAAAEALVQARRSFHYALASERGHLRLFAAALQHIQECEGTYCERLAHTAAYYVCPECGFTATRSELDQCPVCRRARDEFELIS